MATCVQPDYDDRQKVSAVQSASTSADNRSSANIVANGVQLVLNRMEALLEELL